MKMNNETAKCFEKVEKGLALKGFFYSGNWQSQFPGSRESFVTARVFRITIASLKLVLFCPSLHPDPSVGVDSAAPFVGPSTSSMLSAGSGELGTGDFHEKRTPSFRRAMLHRAPLTPEPPFPLTRGEGHCLAHTEVFSESRPAQPSKSIVPRQ